MLILRLLRVSLLSTIKLAMAACGLGSEPANEPDGAGGWDPHDDAGDAPVVLPLATVLAATTMLRVFSSIVLPLSKMAIGWSVFRMVDSACASQPAASVANSPVFGPGRTPLTAAVSDASAASTRACALSPFAFFSLPSMPPKPSFRFLPPPPPPEPPASPPISDPSLSSSPNISSSRVPAVAAAAAAVGAVAAAAAASTVALAARSAASQRCSRCSAVSPPTVPASMHSVRAPPSVIARCLHTFTELVDVLRRAAEQGLEALHRAALVADEGSERSLADHNLAMLHGQRPAQAIGIDVGNRGSARTAAGTLVRRG